MKLYFETQINLPFEKVRDQFNKDLFIFLGPAFIPFELERFDGCKKGDVIKIKYGASHLRGEWVSHVTFEETNAEGWSFIDEGRVLPWPLNYWKHHHRVDKISPTECKIVEDIEYECISPMLAKLIKPFMWSVFAIRPERYHMYFKDRV